MRAVTLATRALPLVLLLVVAVRADAAELVVRDGIGELELPPTHYRYQLSTGGGSASGSDGFRTDTALLVGLRWSVARPGDAVGLVGGVALASEGAAGGNTTLADFGARAELGAGYAVTDAWLLTLTGTATIGEGRFHAGATNGAPAITEHGPYHGFAAILGARWLATRAVGCSAETGYWADRHQLAGDAAQLRLERSGGFVGVGVVWRFSSAPEHLP